MIKKVKIVEVLGRCSTLVRGEGILMRGESEMGQFPVVAYLKEFPIGLIPGYMVGEELFCLMKNSKTKLHARAEVLPLNNQGGQVMGDLVSTLINLANQAGKEDIESLPKLPGTAAFGPLPHPRAAELERLLSLDSDVDDLNGEDPTPDAS